MNNIGVRAHAKNPTRKWHIWFSDLFQRERSVITKHINNVFKEGELDEKSNVQNLHISGSGV